jgi:hypothetical protein
MIKKEQLGYTIGDDFNFRRKRRWLKNKPEVSQNPVIYIYIVTL